MWNSWKYLSKYRIQSGLVRPRRVWRHQAIDLKLYRGLPESNGESCKLKCHWEQQGAVGTNRKFGWHDSATDRDVECIGSTTNYDMNSQMSSRELFHGWNQCRHPTAVQQCDEQTSNKLVNIGGAYQGLGGANPQFLTVFCVLTVITLLVLN